MFVSKTLFGQSNPLGKADLAQISSVPIRFTVTVMSALAQIPTKKAPPKELWMQTLTSE